LLCGCWRREVSFLRRRDTVGARTVKEKLMNWPAWLPWALLSALFAGLTAVLAKVGVKGVDSNLATAIRTVVILVFAWGVAYFRNTQPLSELEGRTWLFLVLSGLATGLSWLCYFRALQLGEASRVAPIDKLSLVITIVLAVAFLGEKLQWQDWAGATLIAGGTVFLALPRT
jgi:transporter family protein